MVYVEWPILFGEHVLGIHNSRYRVVNYYTSIATDTTITLYSTTLDHNRFFSSKTSQTLLTTAFPEMHLCTTE
jgi:hypothetical protein